MFKKWGHSLALFALASTLSIIPLVTVACAKSNPVIEKITPTLFKNSQNVDLQHTNLNTLSVRDLINSNDALLKQWIFDNQISGNKKDMTAGSISIRYDQEDYEAGTILAIYKLSVYWTSEGMSTTPSIEYSLALSGLSKTNPSDAEKIETINKSGNFNFLAVNGFLPVIESLTNLSRETRLQTIDQNYLDDIKLDPDFSELNLSIISGSQTTGALTLKLTGEYQNVMIPENLSLIKLSGFKQTSTAYNLWSNMFINVMHLHPELYYEDLQTEALMQNWTNMQWLKYLKDFNAAGGGTAVNLMESINNNTIHNVNFKNITQALTTNNWSSFALEFEYANYIYLNNSWVVDNNSKQVFSYKMENNKQLTKLTDADAMQFIVTNKINVNADVIADGYASFWYIKIIEEQAPEAINSFLFIDPIYEMTYFNDRSIILECVDTTFPVDDWNGSFDVNYKLVLPDDLSSPFNHGNKTISGALKMSTYVADNTQEITNNITLVKPSSSLATRIIKNIKDEYTQTQLEAFIINEMNTINKKPEYFNTNTTSYRLYDASASSENRLNETLLNNVGDLRLFNKTISRLLINTANNTFDRNNHGGFFLDFLRLEFDPLSKANLAKINSQLFRYQLPYTYALGLRDSTHSINGYYYIEISLSDLGYN